jgi:hypothetical protein
VAYFTKALVHQENFKVLLYHRKYLVQDMGGYCCGQKGMEETCHPWKIHFKI